MIPLPPQISQVTKKKLLTGESPLWDHRDGSLYFVDMRKPEVCRIDRHGTFRSWAMPSLLGALALAKGGGLLVADAHGIHRFDPVSGRLEFLINPETSRPEMRFNDGRIDRAGRLWIGSLRPRLMVGTGREFKPDAEPAGKLWRIDPDGSATAMVHGVDATNGVGWSPDDRFMYYTDSLAGRIDVYPFDLATGTLGERRVFATVPAWRGMPDGLTVDVHGYVWSAQMNGWCVTRYAPDGTIDRVLNFPVRTTASATFGGIDFDTLYVTTFEDMLAESELAQQPLAGHVLGVTPGVKGLKETEFGG